jgi:pimeloyl-ACP methyl ester carboxylesterase
MRLKTVVILGLIVVPAGFGDDADRLLRIDHYVQVRSAVPAISGQSTEIYVREVVAAGTVLRGGPAADRVALFIHGAGTPAEVAFDVPYHDYSWMAYLAHAGFDVFAMDMTGYGRSTRPAAMNDPCNLTGEQQGAYVPALIAAPCLASYPQQMTTLTSDWHDIDAVVDRVRALRHVAKLSLLGWSLGGPRAAGYAAAGRAGPDTRRSTRIKSRSWYCLRLLTIGPRLRSLQRKCLQTARR